ncbi:Dyp-type peroxidase [Fructilactobacillus sanfranciscensis]|uniref:Dyp-type peroxidase n=1 Tax=Fructilactobacillus sanfranciscensis TaxID=1625 RepID=UPI000CD43889|nr:Dyp-type peroxidase [Fructilactobacillus sanfranciscensis]MCG7195699.1 Dyp-type peroxidase [Fructilactobacillus sanfranciscensis]
MVVKMEPDKAQAGIQEFADRSQAIIRSMRIREPEADLRVAIGFSNKAWNYLFPKANKPKELEDFTGVTGPEYSMPATDGDIFLHIRAKNQAVVYEVVTQYRKFLKDFTNVLDEVKGFRYLEGRAIIGFIDGTEAPQVEDAAPYAIIGDEDPEFVNGSYLFTQKWIHDMDFWNKMTVEHQDKAVGREKFSDLELEDEDKYTNAHNLASNTGDENKIVRMNVPFSDPASDKTGTYFMGYARHWSVTKEMLQQMVDRSDFLLTFSTLKTGTLYFVPSRPMLDAIAAGELNPED